MKERKKALERLVAVKTQMEQAERARLAEIERRGAAARQDRDAMIGFLDKADGGDRLLLGFACRRVAAAERGAAALETAAAAQRQALAQRVAQKKGAEKLLKAAAEALAREEEKRALHDLGERLAAAPPTSFP